METSDRLSGDGSVEGDQASLVRDSQAQQIHVGEMLRAGLREIEAFRFEKAERVGPEAVAFNADEFGQDAAHAFDGETEEWVTGIAHDTETAVFRDGQVAQPWRRLDLNQLCAEA